jgi:hypothetical protein
MANLEKVLEILLRLELAMRGGGVVTRLRYFHGKPPGNSLKHDLVLQLPARRAVRPERTKCADLSG